MPGGEGGHGAAKLEGVVHRYYRISPTNVRMTMMSFTRVLSILIVPLSNHKFLDAFLSQSTNRELCEIPLRRTPIPRPSSLSPAESAER
jgi:hypothetical protein